MGTLVSGDLFGFFKMILEGKLPHLYIIVYTLISYIAITFYMLIVKNFGAVTGVFAGTARKAMSLVLSFLLFPKAFSWFFVFGSVLVLGGLLFSSLVKIKKKSQSKSENKSEETENLISNSSSKV